MSGDTTASTAGEAPSSPRASGAEGRGHALALAAAGARWAIPLAAVVEVLPFVEHRSVPGAPTWLRGVFDRRGALVPLVDAGSLLGGDPIPARCGSRIVVVDAGPVEGVPPGAALIGVLVESVDDIVALEARGSGAHPGVALDGGDHLGAIVPAEGGSVQVLRLERMLDDDHRRILFDRRRDGAGGDA